MIPNGQNSINPSNYFEKLPKLALKPRRLKRGFSIFVVTVIGQSNKTELNNSRGIILKQIAQNWRQKPLRSDKVEFFNFLSPP
jgi:hypothetical protein